MSYLSETTEDIFSHGVAHLFSFRSFCALFVNCIFLLKLVHRKVVVSKWYD